MLLKIAHLGNDAAVCDIFGMGWCPLANQLQQVALKREYELGEQGVVSLLIATGGKTTVYRHQRTIIIDINHIAYREGCIMM